MEKYRKALLIDKRSVEARIASASVEQMHTTDSVEETDQIQNRNSKDILTKMLEKDYLKLKQINAALKRISEDKYGECDVCGCEIEEKRLFALPLARYCIDCQEDIDNNIK